MDSLLTALLEEVSVAWSKHEWAQIELLSKMALTLGAERKLADNDMENLAKQYLGSCLTTCQFPLSPGQESKLFESKIQELRDLCRGSSIEWILQKPCVQSADEMVQFARSSSDQDRGKIASAMRKVSRPDLAIEVANSVLNHSRLNYYALATKGAALTDLKRFDEAIQVLVSAIQPFHPSEGLDRSLNALSRSLRERGMQTGDVEDLEDSVEVAQFSFNTYPTYFSRNTYIAALRALGEDSTIEQVPDTDIELDCPRSELPAQTSSHAIEALQHVLDRNRRRLA